MNRTQRGREMDEWITRHPAMWLGNYFLFPGRALTEAIYLPLSKEESRGKRVVVGLVWEMAKTLAYLEVAKDVAIKAGDYFAR